MNPIFVDTSAWFAVVSRRDRDHTACEQFLRENQRLLLTTDYIVDETATLVQARIDHRTAVRFIDRIQASVPNHKFCKKITQAGSVAC